jgi:Flp pilus assembly protein TadD
MPDAAIALADLDARNADWDNALRLANQGVQTKQDSALAYTVLAKVWMAKGNMAQAEAQLRRALDRDPVYLPALAILLDLEVGQGRGKEAIKRISALVTQHSGDARLCMLLAVAYFKQGDLTQGRSRREGGGPDRSKYAGRIRLAGGDQPGTGSVGAGHRVVQGR